MNVALATAAPGTCGACSASLAAGQRYCLACGERRAELPPPFRPPERAPEPAVVAAGAGAFLGGRRSFGAVGAVVLASGVLIGAAVGPALTPSSVASTAGQLVLVATNPAGAVAGGGSQQAASGTGVPGGLVAPSGNVAAPPNKVVNLGGSGGASAPAASSASAPSQPAAPSTPAPTQPAPAPPPTAPAEDPTVSGTVVHVSHGGHGYAVATKDGQLIALHAKHVPVLGDKVKATVLALENSTFYERAVKHQGHVETASFHGTVTYADLQARVYTVSALGTSLLVHMPPPADPSAVPPPPPPVGTLTTVDVTIQPVPAPDPAAPPPDPATPPPPTEQLLEVKRQDGDPASGDLDLEAIVRDPDPAHPDPTQLIVSADDAGESTATLSLHVPPKMDVSKLAPGTVIIATVKRETDGTFTLVTAKDDSDRKAADRPLKPAA